MPNPLKHDYTTKVIPGQYRRVDLDSREYLKACTTEHEPYRPENIQDRSKGVNERWAGCDFQDAVRLYKEGWAQGLNNVSDIQSQITDRLQCRYSKREMCYEIYGGQPDVGVFLTNDPENMIHRTINDRESSHISERKIIKMVINTGASCGQDNVKISSIRGAISIAIMDILEDLGYRVEVECVFANTSYGQVRFKEKHQEFHILMKRAEEPLDREKLAYAMCHASMLRQLGFALFENYGFDDTCCHGTPAIARDQGDLYIPHANVFQFGNNLEEWIKTTLEFLSKVGVKLEDK